MFFNDPFLNQGQLVEQDLKSNIASITVDPLPLSPQGFSGAVGKYNFSASVDKREVKAGDPITLRFVVSGQGNMSLVTIPTPTLPADFESYEPKLSADVNKNGGVLSGKKAADYLLIPRNAGQRTIEPTQFIFFNLEKNSYVSLKSPRFEITVKPGKEPSASSPMIAKEDVRLLGQDIRFLKLKSGGFRPVDEIPFSGEYNIILIILAPLAFIGAFAYRWRMDTLAGNISSVKFRKAAREASKRLKLARKLLEQGNTEQYHTEISRALLGYLEDKLHLPKASLTLDTAAEQMKLKSVNQQVVQNLVSCIERAEFARFAPGADSREGRKDLLDASISAIETVEKEMMGKNKS
jgi:hypothetical protein